MSTPQPHLYRNLRLSLCSLFSLHPSDRSICAANNNSSSFMPTTQQAHDFLLQFQTRNIRRNHHSQVKSKANRQQNEGQQQIPPPGANLTPEYDQGDIGSTWLACIALLSYFLVNAEGSTPAQSPSSVNSHGNTSYGVATAEALFAAQTLLHRLRRIKLVEAVDVEMEPNPLHEVNIEKHFQQEITPESLVVTHRSWSQCLHPILSHVVQRYQPHQDGADEEKIKGELALIMITTLLYCTVGQHCSHHPSSSLSSTSSSVRPIISILGSCLSVTAARLRYTPVSLPEPAAHTQPVVTMVLRSIDMVREAVIATMPMDAVALDRFQQIVHAQVVYSCLAAIPDAILVGNSGSSGGGAYGRLSIDPRCYTAVTAELRNASSGSALVWSALMEIQNFKNDAARDINSNPGHSSEEDLMLQVLFLTTCEQWAKYVPLPFELVHATIPVINQAFASVPAGSSTNGQHHNCQHENRMPPVAAAAMAYWIALVDGGTWTVEQILTSSLLQPNEASRQPNKKRQSSRSKRRNKEVLEELTTDTMLVHAQAEMSNRGVVACRTASMTWETFWPILSNELHIMNVSVKKDYHDPDEEIPGNGPVNGISACANACLPHLLRELASSGEIGTSNSRTESLQLFAAIAQGVQNICSSPVRAVRAFASEALYILHATLLEVVESNGQLPTDIEELAVKIFFVCLMNLATQCGYPLDYFHDLAANNDEELEIERNDVRDILRTVSGCSMWEGAPTPGTYPSSVHVTSRILLRILHACSEAIQEPNELIGNNLFPETAVHAFSSLAKPINHLAKAYDQHSPDRELTLAICNATLGIMASVAEQLIKAFPASTASVLFPLSRLSNLAVSSLSPTLSALLSHPEFEGKVLHVVTLCVKSAAMSIATLPELSAPSTLRSSRYDIRGAMRSPGGEDHVGCLALMRISGESDDLARLFLKADPSIARHLCDLYGQLKVTENERGQGVYYGRGVLPKSRRILLGVVCHLEIVTGGAASVSGVLREIFDSAVNGVAMYGHNQDMDFSSESLFRISENVFDISAFSPSMIKVLYDINDVNSPQAATLKVLHHACLYGYDALTKPMPHDIIFQWNRVRAALYTLLRVSGSPDLPSATVDMTISLIRCECAAILHQSNSGPTSPSPIFREDVIGEEGVVAGNILKAIGELIENAIKAGLSLEAVPNCVRVLNESRSSVLEAITSVCPSPIQKGSFEDPRPTVAEAWLLCVDVIARVIKNSPAPSTVDHHSVLRSLLVDSCASCMVLLLYPTLGKTQEHRMNDSGMSFDGPHSLALTDFLSNYFALGPSMLQDVAEVLLSNVPIDVTELQQFTSNPAFFGLSIVGAALFRAAQGGLPPWAVESIPAVYSSLFFALNKDSDSFGVVFHSAIHVKLLGSQRFGGVQPGSLLSGRFFATMNERAKSLFVAQAVEIARADNISAWRRLKGLVKQACGGKKKDTDFRQRPAVTKWEFDRV